MQTDNRYTHAHTHTHTRAHEHTYTHTRTHKHACAHTGKVSTLLGAASRISQLNEALDTHDQQQEEQQERQEQQREQDQALYERFGVAPLQLELQQQQQQQCQQQQQEQCQGTQHEERQRSYEGGATAAPTRDTQPVPSCLALCVRNLSIWAPALSSGSASHNAGERMCSRLCW